MSTSQTKPRRKLLHRGIFVRNRQDQKQPMSDKPFTCRLGCGEEESQLHLAQCGLLNIFWTYLFDFLNQAGVPPPESRVEAIIFGLWKGDTR